MVGHGSGEGGRMVGDGRGRLGKGAGRGKIWEKHESDDGKESGDGADEEHMGWTSTVGFE